VIIVGKEYIPLFLDFNETTQDLTDEECGRLIRAIVAYANDDDYQNILTGGEKIAFRFLKGLVDRNAAISEKRALARTNKNKTEQNGTIRNRTEQYGTAPFQINVDAKKSPYLCIVIPSQCAGRGCWY
jgi:hypothetical protein